MKPGCLEEKISVYYKQNKLAQEKKIYEGGALGSIPFLVKYLRDVPPVIKALFLTTDDFVKDLSKGVGLCAEKRRD